MKPKQKNKSKKSRAKSQKAEPQKQKKIWTEKEKEAWRLPRKITVSEWADENRVLVSKSSAEPGRWHTSRTPYLRGIMDAFCDPKIEEITVMASTQIGKTEAIYNMLGYGICEDPGPTLLVMPREDDAKTVSANRIKPMIENSEQLKKHLPALEDDITKLEYKLDSMILYFAGSNSPAVLSQRPVRYLFLDEIDKYPRFSGKEADPIELSRERTRTFWNRKIIKVSTPTTRDGYIYREYEKSDQRRYFVPCPNCGEYQYLVFSQIWFPKDERSPEKIKKKRLARYICKKCEKKITDLQKTKMLLGGIWAPENAEISKEGKIGGAIEDNLHRGFWINAIYSPWLTFSDIAAKFLSAQGRPETLMNFINSWLAEIWNEKAEKTEPDKLISKNRDTYPEGIVPAGALVLTAGVDVQKDVFYFVIRGWGVGEESWLIRAAKVENWETLINELFKTRYKKQNSVETLGVRLACMDSAYRTAEVYEICRKWRGITRPTKGSAHLSGMPYKGSFIDRHPLSGKIIAGGLSIYHLDTSYYKDKISRMVHAAPGDAAQWHLFAEPSQEYLRQFCAEQKVPIRNRRTGRSIEEWKSITEGAANHYLDCEVGAAAAADMVGVNQLTASPNETVVYRPQERKESWIKKEGWNSRREGGWLRRG